MSSRLSSRCVAWTATPVPASERPGAYARRFSNTTPIPGTRMSEHGRPIGEAVGGPATWPLPSADRLDGHYTTLLRPKPDMEEELYTNVFGIDPRNFEYCPDTYSVRSREEFHRLFSQFILSSTDPMFFVIQNKETKALSGVLSLLRIDPKNGSAEVGYVTYSTSLQRTRAGTEAQYLLAHYMLDTLGYRRYEWKCDALNAASVSAALRLGFTFEGVFRQVVRYKGRNRDTAWFSIIDKEWPVIRDALEAYLDPANFDASGMQKSKLKRFTTESPIVQLPGRRSDSHL